MGKFTNTRKLTKQEQDELFIRFSKILGSIKNSVEAANLIRDLLSEQEALMLARRIQIAELLAEGYTYETIKEVLHVGMSTIARVQHWMDVYGDGYRAIIKRSTKERKAPDSSSAGPGSWRSLKRKYPMYFWPELALEEILRSASKRERARLQRVLGSLREKTKLSKELEALLRQPTINR